MRYHELTGAGVAGGEPEGEPEGFDELLAFLPRQFLDSDPSSASSLTVRVTPKQAG